jgi:tripartite-type tricarboxylate transporter receptor subunit TctC
MLRFSQLSAAIVASFQFVGPALAQDWPTRTITMVVPFAAGGSTDAVARVLAGGLTQTLGHSVIVENVGGAGGITGANRVAKAAPDGSQFVLGDTGTIAQYKSLYKKPPYNSATDFAPVVLVTEQPMVLVARKDFPATSLSDFIAYTQLNQAKMQYGSAGAGSATHLACALFNAAIGVNVTHVPYRGGAPALQDLIAGRIDYQCPINTAVISQIESHSIKGIAVLMRERSPSLPAVASASEQGLGSFEAPYWTAIFLPSGTSAAIIRKLHDAGVAAMNAPAIQEQMKKIGADLVASDRRSPEYLQKFVKSEIEKWAGAIKASGVSLD